jgi:hypothetical protein
MTSFMLKAEKTMMGREGGMKNTTEHQQKVYRRDISTY